MQLMGYYLTTKRRGFLFSDEIIEESKNVQPSQTDAYASAEPTKVNERLNKHHCDYCIRALKPSWTL